ncbi:hypothetical protein cce_2074 [Crocosphaera subtropica ATCC 51142]|uniref:PEP-CTERM protein-sorting domain-containing protein n=1 Tax=Crocosphaera subtropica (strain ATCC 51142 / BH68) TaxID=43989 RepID=B1X1J5_CROS5|nr:hypothetical protein [Crocosphaera subtropica]ACB51424.1 hypothetical protein cce_2074 [Crocosphaera subtropica ATCC 51142]
MNQNLNWVGFTSMTVVSLTAFTANAQIPQTAIQEVLIQGSSNEVNQQLTQTFFLNFVYLPQIEPSDIPELNIQGSFLDNTNNEVIQQIGKTVLDFPLVESRLTSFSIEDFVNHDGTLNGNQYSTQQALIGNSQETNNQNNTISQISYQTLTNFFWLDDSSGMTGEENFNQFLEKLLTHQKLDSLQFSLQDAIVYGDNNIISQTVEQTFHHFILTNQTLDFSSELNDLDPSLGLDPIQFLIQETFTIDPSNNISANNLVTQRINQLIGGTSFFNTNSLHSVLPSSQLSEVETNSLVDFDIDAFIEAILNDITIATTQISRQTSEILGDENEVFQSNTQVLVTTVPEPNSLKMLLSMAIMGAIALLRK